MDEIDMGQDRAERELAEQIKKARNSSHPHLFTWTDACYCGLVEWTASLRPHFCGTWCRDLYEREARAKIISGKAV